MTELALVFGWVSSNRRATMECHTCTSRPRPPAQVCVRCHALWSLHRADAKNAKHLSSGRMKTPRRRVFVFS